MSANLTILVLTLFIYILIIAAFNKARIKYSGGKVGDVINLILVTVVLMFLGSATLASAGPVCFSGNVGINNDPNPVGLTKGKLFSRQGGVYIMGMICVDPCDACCGDETICIYTAKLYKNGFFRGWMECRGPDGYRKSMPFTGDWYCYHGWFSLIWDWGNFDKGWMKSYVGSYAYPILELC